MFDRLTERARKVLVHADEEAGYFRHGYIGTEHLLLGLLREDKGVAARALATLNVTFDAVREQVESIVGYGLSGTGPEKRLTPRSHLVLQLAAHESARLGHNYIGTEDILLAMTQENEGVAVRILSNLRADADKIREQIYRIVGYNSQQTRLATTPSRDKSPRRSTVEGSREFTKDGEPVQLFYSYSHKDEKLRTQLETHLSTLRRQGHIQDWHFRKILPGHEWDKIIDENLEAAEIVLILVSADFVDSDYCYDKELERALDKHERGQARVIPIVLRPTDWAGAPFSKLQMLPANAKPVTTWRNRDEAWLNVAKGIRSAVNELRKGNRVG